MARRRTRKDKTIARLRRLIEDQERPESEPLRVTSSPPPVDTSYETASRQSDTTEEVRSLFPYDLALLRKDLVRTGILSVLAFSIEVVLFLSLR